MARIVPATEEWLDRAAAAIRGGGLVAFPTETVYGLGANALDPVAVAKIFAAKGRPANNPLIVHIADRGQIESIAAPLSSDEARLAGRFWPGPLTLVVPKSPSVPGIVTAGGNTLGVRIPSHPVGLELIRRAGVPIAAPSANRSESVSPTTAEHVRNSLADEVDLILDGGACSVGLESTVLQIRDGRPVILRPGAVTADDIVSVLGVMPTDPNAVEVGPGPMPSPGRMPRHYAPTADVTVCRDAIDAAMRHPGAAVLTHLKTRDPVPMGVTIRILPADAAGYGRALYAALRWLDDADVSAIFVEEPPEGDAWTAIRDRVTRASAAI